MELAQVNQVMEIAPKGANIVLEWTRNAKTRKGAPQVRKMVRMVGRVGLTYDNIGAVKEKRENGELPKENQGLAEWAEWVKFPFLIKNKKSGQLYLRLYKGTSAKNPPHRQFIMDGQAVSFEAVEAHLLASEKGSHDNTDCFIVKIEDLTRIYSESAEYGAIL